EPTWPPHHGATDTTHAKTLNDTATDPLRAKTQNDTASADGSPAKHPAADGPSARPEDAASLAARRATRRRRFTVLFGLLAIVALAAGLYWFLVGRYSEETDDAYVAGNIVQIAAQIQGTVTDIRVTDTQQVKAGQVLAKLDDADASATFEQAQAQLAQAVRQVANTRISMGMYEETVKAREADLSNLANAQAALASARAQRDAARALGSERPVEQNPSVQQAAAQYKLAYRNLKRTTIVSPVDGTVGQRSVQIGQQVGPGVPLMSVVQLRQVWVEANFKEGQIRHMRVGQPVRLESDLYGSRVTYHGRVEGFSAGTGSAFSMLPSQNAAGNWIKVVQRVPVVISLEASELTAHPLRVGLSMRATVETKARGGHLLDGEAPLPGLRTRVHDGDAEEADAAADAVIRANDGGK
ncbi:efflux RND transporter periplasmic adaptor subunit, partial [Burkholderia oklahomensis]|uniref:efflux RND transporter periplasmic adaptor subunit n=1 Tax=Burkholderia oklahomensis TaxID=342113 RepID=UPI001FC81BC3